MKKFFTKLAKSNRYFIGVDAGPEKWSHMTLKFLGDLSPEEVSSVKNQMSQVAQRTSKLELRPEGYGLLGRSKPNLVDFIEPTDKVTSLFKKLRNNSAVPHITRQYGEVGKHGPFNLIDEQLVEELHLYRSDGYKDYKKVFTVKLQRRSPLEWLKDQFNF